MLYIIPQDISLYFADLDSHRHLRLLPEEEVICEHWRSDDRKTLFRLGRIAAHKALLNLGIEEQRPVLRGSEGEPLWPEGIVGSISNTTGAAVAVVAPGSHYCSIGVDIELKDRFIRPDTARFLCTDRELELFHRDEIPLLRLFSAKECVYKAFSPLLKRYIGFKDVELSWTPQNSSWGIKPLSKELPLIPWDTLRIYSIEREDLLFSLLWLPQI